MMCPWGTVVCRQTCQPILHLPYERERRRHQRWRSGTWRLYQGSSLGPLAPDGLLECDGWRVFECVGLLGYDERLSPGLLQLSMWMTFWMLNRIERNRINISFIQHYMPKIKITYMVWRYTEFASVNATDTLQSHYSNFNRNLESLFLRMQPKWRARCGEQRSHTFCAWDSWGQKLWK